MDEVVGLGYCLADFLEQGFQVFFGTLLAVETDCVMKRRSTSPALTGDDIIGVGLFHPLSRHPLHTTQCPLKQFREGTSRLPLGAIPSFLASAPADPSRRGP